MTSARRIDFHFHLIPKFYRDAVYEAGTGPQIGRYPDWSPEQALDVMDAHAIEVALTSLAQPGVQFGDPDQARAGAPLQRPCGRAQRALAQAVRRLCGGADVGHARRHRGNRLRPR
jgi:hypothetical protein